MSQNAPGLRVLAAMLALVLGQAIAMAADSDRASVRSPSQILSEVSGGAWASAAEIGVVGELVND